LAGYLTPRSAGYNHSSVFLPALLGRLLVVARNFGRSLFVSDDVHPVP
jgi:hypothetical protein